MLFSDEKDRYWDDTTSFRRFSGTSAAAIRKKKRLAALRAAVRPAAAAQGSFSTEKLLLEGVRRRWKLEKDRLFMNHRSLVAAAAQREQLKEQLRSFGGGCPSPRRTTATAGGNAAPNSAP